MAFVYSFYALKKLILYKGKKEIITEIFNMIKRSLEDRLDYLICTVIVRQ